MPVAIPARHFRIFLAGMLLQLLQVWLGSIPNAVGVEPSESAQKLPSPVEEPSQNSFGLKLPDGSVIELVGVCVPSTDRPWWRADGSQLAKAPDAPFDKTFKVRPVANSLVREFLIDSLADKAPEMCESRHRLNGVFSLTNSSSTTREGAKIRQRLRLIQQVVWKGSTTVELDYGLSPWETVTAFDRPSRSIFHAYKRADGTGVVIGRPDEVNNTTTIMATYDLRDLEHRAVRIVAIDNQGQMHLPQGDVLQSLRAAHVLFAAFGRLKQAEIRSVLFQTRSVLHIKFRNVSLNPGQRTAFEVLIDEQVVVPRKQSPSHRPLPRPDDRSQIRGVQKESPGITAPTT